MNGSRVIRNGKMKKGRKYIEPVTGKGDKKGTNISDKDKKKVSVGGKTWDGVSRPSNDMYRDAWVRIFGVKDDETI